MAFKKKGGKYKSKSAKEHVFERRPPIRHHKGMVFRPIAQFDVKKDAKKWIKKKKLSETHHYRIYKHKYHGWRIYMGDPKVRYGGEIRKRHRPTRKELYKRYRRSLPRD